MKIFLKRTLATIMVVLILLTSAPLGGFVDMEWPEFTLPDFSSWFSGKASAVSDGYYTYSVTDNKATIVSVDATISGEITIPEMLGDHVVTKIARRAFKGCENITSIVISNSVIEIGDYAFSGCSQLSSIDLGNTEILGSRIFEEATSLKTVTIPKEVTEASHTLTDSSVETVTFEEGIANIPEYICYGAEQLKNVTIPEKTNTEDGYVIGKCAFYGTGISEINLPESLTKIEQSAFFDNTSLESIVIPDSVTEIGDYAFSGCSQLCSIDLGNTEILGSRIFEEATSLKMVTIPKEVIEASHTLTDSSVETVTFEEGIANIPEYICYGAEQLKNVTIPEKTNTEDGYVIGKYSFYGTDISEINLPESLNEIGESAFSNCLSLKTIIIPNDVTVIKDDAFRGCNNVAAITLSEGLVEIGSYAFSETKIQSFSTPKTLKTIGSYAFADCTALESVVFNEGLEEIYYCAFSGTIIECVIIPSTVKLMAYEPVLKYFSCFYGAEHLTTVEFSAAPDGETSIIPEYALYNCPSIETVIMPETVVSIGNGAFSGCSKISDIVLNEGLKVVGKCAFSGTAIQSITIPSSVTIMHDQPVFESLNSCLYGAENLKEVIFAEAPDGKSSIIPDYALYNCNSVETVELPECINSIGEYAFAGTKISFFVAPENLVQIGTSAFENCSLLKNVTLNNGLQEIHHSAFSSTLLEEISVPYTVVKLSSSKGFKEISCFAGAEKLNTVVFESAPEGKTSIVPAYALYNCANVQSIIIPDSVIEIGANALNCSTFNTLKIPDSVKTFGKDFINKATILKFNNNLDAAIYAINNELFYEGSFIEESEKFDYLTFSLTSSNNVSSNVALAIDYSIIIDEFKKMDSPKFNVYIPKGAKISKVTIDQKATQYSYYSSNNTLRINDIPSEGSIRIYLDLSGAQFIRSYAQLSYNKTESDIFAVLDDKSRYGITVSGATTTYSHEYIVSGLAQPDTQLDIYVDNINISSVTTNKVGSFSKTISLPNKGEYGTYKIKVKSTAFESDTLNVKYYSKAPVLKSLTMHYGNKTYDLTNVNKKHNINFSTSYSPSFEVRLTNSEYIEKLMIVSSKPTGDKYIEAVYNKSKGCFVASGYFDKDNKSYVPGTISIAYYLKYDSDSALKQLNTPVIFNEAGKEYIASAELIEHNKTEKDESVVIGFDDGMQLEVSNKEYSIDELIEEYRIEAGDNEATPFVSTFELNPIRKIAELLVGAGFTLAGDFYIKHADKEITVLKYNAETDTFEKGYISVKKSESDSDADNETDSNIDTMNGIIGNIVDSFEIDLGEIGDISELIGSAEKLLKYGAVQINLNNMRQRIQQSSGDASDKQEWLKEIDDLESSINLLCILKILMPIIGEAAGGIGDILLATGAGAPGTALAYIVDGLTIAIDEAFLNIWQNSIEVELQHYEDLNKIIIADVKDASKVNWNIDPSGYVYEAISSNRLQDVTTTIYFKDLENNVTLWDASDYDQENPILTDENGQYSWDVPEGWWQVECEKDGYETTYSEWLPVPPPQLDVNLGLVTTQSPEVNFVNVYKDYSEVVFSQYMDISTINSNTISFMQSGEEIIGTWEAIDKEVSATDTSVYYAKIFKFIPEDNFSGNVNIKIANVKNYADIKIKAEYTNTFYVNNPITNFEVPETVEISYENNTSFVIKATPVASAKNKTVTIELSNDYVVQCADKVTLDENGEAVIYLKSLLPGEVKLECKIDGTTISNTVNIVSPINVSLLSKKEYSITWIIDDETITENYMVDELIVAPINIFKKGFVFSGWTANIPQTMPEEDLTFEAMFIECDHSLVDWKIVSPATCTEIGEKVKSCTCGINVTDTIPATNHNGTLVKVDGKASTCTKTGLTEGSYCSACGEVIVAQKTIAKKAHTYKTTTTKATLSKNGKAVKKCTVCGYTSKTITIYYPKSIKLSTTAYTYNGKVKTPSVTVKDYKGNTLKKDTDYTVKYESGRKTPGKYTVTITFKGKYSGTRKLYFTIAPKSPTKLKASQSTTAIKLSWAKVTGATGYRVYKYNTKTKKYEKLKDVTATSLTIGKLKTGSKYKFRVKAYTKDGDAIWSEYSSSFETATKPATPTLKVTSTSKGKAALTWKNVTGESGYQIYYSTKKSSGFKLYGTAKTNVIKATVSKLTSGKTYYFRVRAYTKTASGNVYGDYKTVSVKVK